jgi:hypothetical protein
MRVCVPIFRHGRDTTFAPTVAACLLFVGTLAVACTGTPTTADDNTGVSASVTVTLEHPTVDEAAVPFAGTVNASGKFKLDSGLALIKAASGENPVVATLGDHAPVPCTVSAGTFKCAIDTTLSDDKQKPFYGCNESVSLVVTVKATGSGGVSSGTAGQDVEIDNCAPQASLVALDNNHKPLPAGVTPKFVDRQWIRFSVSDPRLESATFDVLGQDPDNPDDPSAVKSILPGGPLSLPKDLTTWKMDYLLQTTQLGKTEMLQVVLTGKDHTTEAVTQTLDLFTVKSTVFLGTPNDTFSQGINDFVIPNDPDRAPNNSIVAFTADPTPTSATDKLTDVVVASNHGVYIRAGMPRRDGAGTPLDINGTPLLDACGNPNADTDVHVHSLAFEDLSQGDKLAAYRVIRGTTAEIKANATADIARVFLRDLDNDSDLDIIAVGTISGDGDTRGEVWAILNVPAEVVVPLHDAGCKPVSGPVNLRAFKLVDSLVLPSPPRTAEMADLNNDGMDDLLIGSGKTIDAGGQKVDFGLMTLLVLPGPSCQPVNAALPPQPCSEVLDDTNPNPLTYTTLRSGHVFAAAVKVAPNMGVTGVTSIATGDFWAADGLDVCVGSADRPIVSCYRNVAQDGSLNQAQDAYQFKEGLDTGLIRAVDLPVKGAILNDGTDLIVASASGEWVRWLKSTANGQFTFNEGAIILHRDVPGLVASAMAVAPIGPKGDPYVIVGTSGREVTILPLSTEDDEYSRACFRSWIVGTTSIQIAASDIDGDGALDIASADSQGIQIAVGAIKGGAPDGSFIAPTAHHICASPWPLAGPIRVSPIVTAKVADFNKDNMKELLMFAGVSSSLKGPVPVWPIAVFMTENGRLNPEARQSEFSPYAFPANVAGLTSAADPFGSVRAAAVGDVNHDGYPDLVTVRTESAYPVGKVKDAGGCGCLFDEQNELDNRFGEDGMSVDETHPAQKERCCRNFAPIKSDPDRVTPLMGFGGSGAVLSRASADLFLSTKDNPLGIHAGHPPLSPDLTKPDYAFAAGRNPVDVQMVDVDGDGWLDVVTAMDNDGKPCISGQDGDLSNLPHVPFLQARMRVFKNTKLFKDTGPEGKGYFQPTFMPTDSKATPQPDRVEIAICEDPLQIGFWPVSYRTMPDGIQAITSGAWPTGKDGAPDAATIFGLGHTYGQIGILPHISAFNYGPRTTTPMGGSPDAFAASDINQDGIADMLVLSNLGNTVAVLTGKVVSDSTLAAFEPQTALTVANANFPGAVAAAMGDVNHDGVLDLVLVSKTSNVVFLLGVGDGTFVTYPGSQVADEPLALDMADMDGDGCDDIVVRSKFSVTVIQNQGVTADKCGAALRWAHDVELQTLANPAP